MKNAFYLLLSAFIMLIALNSCQTDELDLDKAQKFSKQSVEELKQKTYVKDGEKIGTVGDAIAYIENNTK